MYGTAFLTTSYYQAGKYRTSSNESVDIDRSDEVDDRQEISFILLEHIYTCFGIREREDRDLRTEFRWTEFRSDSRWVFNSFWKGVSKGPGCAGYIKAEAAMRSRGAENDRDREKEQLYCADLSLLMKDLLDFFFFLGVLDLRTFLE